MVISAALLMAVSVMMFSGTGAFAQSSPQEPRDLVLDLTGPGTLGEPSGAVAVGSLLPLTQLPATLQRHGEENYAASLLAVDDRAFSAAYVP